MSEKRLQCDLCGKFVRKDSEPKHAQPHDELGYTYYPPGYIYYCPECDGLFEEDNNGVD